MTVDVRAVNAQTEAMFWPMPILEVVMDHLQGAKVFFVIDFFKGYWQLPLAEASQGLFSILTDEGIYTPTRVLMGGSECGLLPSGGARIFCSVFKQWRHGLAR
jgi:hypothetical protein